ncbi:MAG: histidinol dehydrogenase [Prolixibacteraceae bacterium]|jgi:histidinol dehydrogenase|nr:histidinol dehydrogenase [Prolixibacteraceae bacterium]
MNENDNKSQLQKPPLGGLGVVVNNPFREEWSELLKRPVFETTGLNKKVQAVLDEVKLDGDVAVKKYTSLFDKVELDDFLVTGTEIEEGIASLDGELKSAIETATDNIRKFHESQRFETQIIETTSGVKCWQKSVGIEKVGLYIPGGTAPLFSTVLMLAIPANIAGCKEIVLCTPPQKDGKLPAAVLFAAQLSGITKIFKIGGIQAIGAMAYGTESVPKVFKIFGPGNQFVTAAKQLVSIADVSIDMPAGPSEVEVLADEPANAAFVASDLLSQAEHGADSQVLLITNSAKLIEGVQVELQKQLEVLPRMDYALKAIDNSKIILLDNVQDMIDITNAYAPEHLIVAMRNYSEVADQIINAGSIFLGNYTPESAGDYASGTNHTLPTNGWATSYSGVNLDSFIKKITYQEISKEGIQKLGPVIEKMAEAESLFAHKNAATLRMTPQPPKGGDKFSMNYGAEPILFEFAKQLRLNPTEAEEFLWNQLSSKKMGVRFKRQHPVLYFIADFYCHQAKLIIEVDGAYHQIPVQYNYDSNRDAELESLGLRVLRFTHEQVLFDVDKVIDKIEKEIKRQINE